MTPRGSSDIWRVRERYVSERTVYVRASSASEAKQKALEGDTVDVIDDDTILWWSYPGRAVPSPNHNGEQRVSI